MSQMCFNKASVCIPLQKKESDEEESKEVAVEEGDQTGDSGMESGSGSVQHGTISQWREAIKKPPPGNNSISYQHLKFFYLLLQNSMRCDCFFCRT